MNFQPIRNRGLYPMGVNPFPPPRPPLHPHMVPPMFHNSAMHNFMPMQPGPEFYGTPQHFPQEGPEMFQRMEYMERKSIIVDGAPRFTPSAVHFDREEELVWTGNLGGHVTSHYGPELQKYTSFQVHENAEVRDLRAIQNSVVALCPEDIRFWSRYGRKQFIYQPTSLSNMQCMHQSGPSTIVVGGHDPQLIEFDITAQKELRQVESSADCCAILRQSTSFLCCGDIKGKISLRDPKTLRQEHELQCHNGMLSDFDVLGNQLISCGFSNRLGTLHPDHFLIMYDLRMIRALPPLTVPIDPIFLRFVSTFADRICLVNQSGQFQVIEQAALTAASMAIYQVETQGTPLSCFDVSSAACSLAFCDTAGVLHLYNSTHMEEVHFNKMSRPTEFPRMESNHPPISINDVQTPYSVIAMHYPTKGQLSSYWPPALCKTIYRRPAQIDPEILHSMKMVGNIGYAPNNGKLHRNQVDYVLKGASKNQVGGNAGVPDSPLGREENPWVQIPKRYHKLVMKYSKWGLDDFDFRHYNKTSFAGLETHIPNAYCNAMLQVMYFIDPIRCTLQRHLCPREFCLSCELGFLFHMLDGQKGGTCQASNFLRAFRTIREASALGLVLNAEEEAAGKISQPRLIQNWCRFIVQQMHGELLNHTGRRISPPSATETAKQEAAKNEGSTADMPWKDTLKQPSEFLGTRSDQQTVMRQLFGSELDNTFKCQRCGQVQTRRMTATVIDLLYQEEKPREKDQKIPVCSFSTVIERSVNPEQFTQAWCSKCSKYQPHIQKKTLQTLPDIFVFNCHLEGVQDFEFWRAQDQYKSKSIEEKETPEFVYSARSSFKTCRYGASCTRKDCKFLHEGDLARGKVTGKVKVLQEEFPTESWVPPGIRIKMNSPLGQVKVEDIEQLSDKVKEEPGQHEYELTACVVHIHDVKSGEGDNLVSCIKVNEAYHRRKEGVSHTQWYLFNDFSINPISQAEALHFSPEWKIPCLLLFTKRNMQTKYDLQVKCPLKSQCLLNPKASVSAVATKKDCISLTQDELSTKDKLVGLDAEFVSLNQEEAELRSDGTRSTLKPSQLSAARVSCVRGWDGPMQFQPFLDDYISTPEQVVDFLTQFSGIKPGDLDPNLSSKYLTCLKDTYVQLRYLVDHNFIFVGHGLKKDLRVLNLIVPKNQIIDTVTLFHKPHQRMISLRFLAWYFLGEKIQSHSHDSIEDACTALKLYYHYRKLQNEGSNMDDIITKLYQRGRSLAWQVPNDSSPEELEKNLLDLAETDDLVEGASDIGEFEDIM